METDPPARRFQRAQFAVVLVLSSLNGTFERKCLVVPFAPDVLKLGRQTTSRTQAAPDNGYFDSRVLSRQHAEIWADYDTGKVWLQDAKSSNGTYINKKRLSAENTESEPHELRGGDQLDLGVDISCNDDPSQMYKKISARVEKVSMLPLNVGLAPPPTAPPTAPQAAPSNLDTSASSVNIAPMQRLQRTKSGKQPARPPALPSLHRSPSVETLKSANGNEAIFGPLKQADLLALNHAHTTAGGQLVREAVTSNVNFDIAAKRLVQQIRAVKADTAKIQSVSHLLESIKTAATEAAERDAAELKRIENEKQELLRLRREGRSFSKSSSLAALKAENTRLRAELANHQQPRRRGLSVSNQESILSTPRPQPQQRQIQRQQRPPASHQSTQQQQQQHASHHHVRPPPPPDSKIVLHNVMVLVGTTLLVTLAGVWIMFFFNPPEPRNGSLLFFNPNALPK